MVSAKKKRAQRQKQYMKNKDVDMKEYYENNKSPIKLSQNKYYEQNKDAKKRVGISGMKKIRMLKG